MTAQHRSLRVFLLIPLLLFVLTGCTTSFYDPIATMRPPRATGEMEGLQQALELYAGRDIILKYPRSGQHRSAFLLHDLDGDGKDEALAFYRSRVEGSVTQMGLLRVTEDGWVYAQELSSAGNDLLDVRFGDLDGDHIDEIIAGWSVFNSKENRLCVYKMDNGRLTQRADEVYTEYVLCDIDNNDRTEIGIVRLNTADQAAGIRFLNIDDRGVTVLASAPLDGGVSGYADIKTARLQDGVMGVYIDAYKSSSSMITELIYFKDDKLVCPFYDAEEGVNRATFRPFAITSRDINRDGTIEIPFSTVLPGYETSPTDQKQYLTMWKFYNGSVYLDVLTGWYNYQDGYYVEFNTQWKTAVTVRYNTHSHTAVFSDWNAEQQTAGEDLLSIRVLGAGEWEKSPPADYAALDQSDNLVWIAKITGKNNVNTLSAQSVVWAFHRIGIS